MNTDLHEINLPGGPRAAALQHARVALGREAKPAEPGGDQAVDQAFASYEPAPRRTDSTHEQQPAGVGDAIKQISVQLEQIEQQRRELNRLLKQLDGSV